MPITEGLLYIYHRICSSSNLLIRIRFRIAINSHDNLDIVNDLEKSNDQTSSSCKATITAFGPRKLFSYPFPTYDMYQGSQS